MSRSETPEERLRRENNNRILREFRSVGSSGKCVKHPHYVVGDKPTSDCQRCLTLYIRHWNDKRGRGRKGKHE